MHGISLRSLHLSLGIEIFLSLLLLCSAYCWLDFLVLSGQLVFQGMVKLVFVQLLYLVTALAYVTVIDCF